MPKIRKKAKLKKIDGSYPEKSGVLSKSIKKIIQDEDSLQGRIPEEFFLNKEFVQNKVDLIGLLDTAGADMMEPTNDERNYPVFNNNKFNLDQKNIYFNDQKINSLSSQEINPVLGLPKSVIEKTKIFSSPNIFQDADEFLETREVSNKNYNILENEEYSFKKDVSFNESHYTENIEQQEIIIDLDFKDDLILDNLIDISDASSTNECEGHYTFRKGLTDPEVYRSHGAPDESIGAEDGQFYQKHTAYFNFNRSGWDYLYRTPYLENEADSDHDLYKGYVPIFSPSTEPSPLSSVSARTMSSTIGAPNTTSGFPWAHGFAGGYENLLYMGNYISKDFIVEDISFECIVTSRCEAFSQSQDNTSYYPDFLTRDEISLSNSLNFFILNQRNSGVNNSYDFQIQGVTEYNFAQYIHRPDGIVFGGQPSNDFMFVRLSGSFDSNSSAIDSGRLNFGKKDFLQINRIKGLPYGTGNLINVKPADQSTPLDTDNSGYYDHFATFFEKSKNFSLKEVEGSADIPSYAKLPLIGNTWRELVSYHNFVFYNEYNAEDNNVDFEKATKEADLSLKIENETTKGLAHMNFTSGSFTISGKCVKPKKYINTHAFSYFWNRKYEEKFGDHISGSLNNKSLVFLNSEGERDLLGNLSTREPSTTFADTATYSKNFVIRKTFGNTFISGDEINSPGSKYDTIVSYAQVNDTKQISPYIIKPEDTLIFGVNSFSNIDEFPALIKLHDKVRIKIKGRYENTRNNNVTLSNKRGMTSNSIRSTIIGNTPIVNKSDSEPIYFMSGSYLDNKFTGDVKSPVGRTIVGSLSSGLEGSFTRTVTLKDTKNTIYDSMMPDIFEIFSTSNKKVPAQLTSNLDDFFADPSSGLNFPESQNDVTSLDKSNIVTNLALHERTGYTNLNTTKTDFLKTLSIFNWNYEFPFENKYKNIKRNLNRNYSIILDSSKLKDNVEDIDLLIGGESTGLQEFYEYDESSRLIFLLASKSTKNASIVEASKIDVINKILYGQLSDKDNFSINSYKDIEKFKYGVYNANPVTLTKHYNWRSYGQFSDKYNGSINTAFFNQDQAIIYPVRKTFVDSNLNNIEASNAQYTYNTDDHARSGRPFFE